MCLPRSVNLLKLQSFFINAYTEKVDSCSYGQIWNMGITLMELVKVPPKKGKPEVCSISITLTVSDLK